LNVYVSQCGTAFSNSGQLWKTENWSVERSGLSISTDWSFPDRISRAMVKSMTAAWAAPHFGFADEVVLDPLLRTRDALRGVLAPHGLRLTFLPLLIKAASLALARAPALNGRLDAAGEAFTHLAAHNIGVAMDTPRGLIVPNIKGVQELSVLEIALELKRLQGLAQAGALKEAYLAGGSFTCVAHAAPRPLLPRSARADALTSLSLSLSLPFPRARARSALPAGCPTLAPLAGRTWRQ
jgi:hypothetical protein